MSERSDRESLRRRPVHPPFTGFPVAAYVFVAAFDVLSVIGGRQHQWATQLWHAGTFVLIAGLAICLVTMGTGFGDLIRFWPGSPRAVRTTAIHVCVMAGVFMVGAGDIAWRLSDYDSTAVAPLGVAVLSVVAAVTATTGAFFGGTLVFRHGLGVAPSALPTADMPSAAPSAADMPTTAGASAAAGAVTTAETAARAGSLPEADGSSPQ